MVLNVTDFPAGNYQLTCNGTGPNGGTWGTQRYDVPANGSVQLTCFFGGRGDEAWVGVTGWGPADRMTWY